MTGRVLVLGGTGEGRRLATALVEEGVPVLSSLAGRVADPVLPPGEVRIGGFGGADGLRDWLRAHPVRALVDATHPFAATMTSPISPLRGLIPSRPARAAGEPGSTRTTTIPSMPSCAAAAS